ncbi:unnamed protein product [Peronospora belbahrii]|uniref:Hexose transporter 1 n=1 Tax=Peronospora belbahrii TaxID=622444 RepID=A0ABN8CT57_9STRA|nr:unnamed protein product [Peronospora belbahrii]
MALHESTRNECNFVQTLAPIIDAKPLFDTKQRSLRPTWIVYSSAAIAVLQAFHYGWSTSQVNLNTFSSVETCNARPVEEGTCLMFPGHSKTTWTLLVNAWIVGGMCGSLLSGFPSNKWGRRTTLRFNGIIMTLGSIIQVLSTTPAWFTVGRFVTGIANGLAAAVVNTFLNEISTPHNRHALGTNTHLAVTLGVIGVASTFWYWNTASGFRWIAGMPISFAGASVFLSYFFMVESPVWLVANGQIEEAEKELGRLYGKDNVSTLMGWIQGSDYRSKLPSIISGAFEKAHVETNWTILTNKKFRKPLIIALGLTCANQLGGINAVFLYSSSILKNAGISDSRLGIMIIDVLNVIPVPISAVLSHVMRKRTMLISGISMMSLCCIGITVSLVYSVGWLSIAFLGLFVVSYTLSIGALLSPIVAELFSDSARGAAVGIVITVKWASTLVVGITFPYVQDATTTYSFIPFLCTTSLSVIFIYFMVPETSDKTIAEIQEEFCSNRSMQLSHKSQIL